MPVLPSNNDAETAGTPLVRRRLRDDEEAEEAGEEAAEAGEEAESDILIYCANFSGDPEYRVSHGAAVLLWPCADPHRGRLLCACSLPLRANPAVYIS